MIPSANVWFDPNCVNNVYNNFIMMNVLLLLLKINLDGSLKGISAIIFAMGVSTEINWIHNGIIRGEGEEEREEGEVYTFVADDIEEALCYKC